MSTFLRLSGAVALLAIAAFFGVLAHVVGELPRKVDALQADVNKHALFLRAEASRQIEAARIDVLTRSDRQMTTLEKDMIALVDRHATTSINLLDLRTGEALATVHVGMALANGQVNGIREDAKPVLVNAAALVKDAQDSLDDVYWDLKASVESGTMAARGIAEASEAIGKAAPAMAESAGGITRNMDGITADVHTATSNFVKPRTFFERLKMWIDTGVRALWILL